MANYSLYTQSGAQLKKIPNTSERKKFNTLEDAVRFGTAWLTMKSKLNRSGKSRLEINPDLQIIVMEYTNPYSCKIVAILGKDSIKNIEVKPENNSEKF